MKIKYFDPETGLPLEQAQKLKKIILDTTQKILEENKLLQEKIIILENENNELRNKIQTLEAQLSQLQADIQVIKKEASVSGY
ncbi:MAG: hypothetical protein QXT12_05800 [Nitrososphaerota archaeon]